MKKFWMTLLFLLFVPNALAGLSISETFTNGDAQVTVESSVTELTDGYFYTYQIKGIGDLNITQLSIPFSTPLAKLSEIYGFEWSDAPVTPYYWDTIGDLAISANAFFAPMALTSDGESLILRFESVYDAEEVQGYVSDAQQGSLHGTLLAPVPEPVTLSLFAIGAGVVFRRKYRTK